MVNTLTVYLRFSWWKILLYLLNMGTFHDTTMAEYGLYGRMEKVYNATGAKIMVDSSFNTGIKYYLIKSA